jgi:hypothetical protein
MNVGQIVGGPKFLTNRMGAADRRRQGDREGQIEAGNGMIGVVTCGV